MIDWDISNRCTSVMIIVIDQYDYWCSRCNLGPGRCNCWQW